MGLALSYLLALDFGVAVLFGRTNITATNMRLRLACADNGEQFSSLFWTRSSPMSSTPGASPRFTMTLPLDTPLSDSGYTDLDWYRRMIEWHMKCGIRSFLLDGTTGGWTGSGVESRIHRQRQAINFVKELGGVAAVNIASGSVDDTCWMAEEAVAETAPDLLVVMLPGVPTVRADANVVEFCRAVSKRLPGGVAWGLYEFGSLLGPRFNAATIGEILQFERPPVSIKWTDPQDPFAALRIARQFHSERFRVIPSHEVAIQLSIEEGLPEFVSGAIVPLPELAVAFERFAAEPTKLSICQGLMNRWLLDFSEVCAQPGRDFFTCIKAAMAARHEGYPLFMMPGVRPVEEEAIDDCRVAIERILQEIPK